MPLFHYGTQGDSRKRRLYTVDDRLIETKVWNQFLIDKLAPYKGLPNLANFWYFNRLNHCAMSWHDDRMIEQTIFIPGLLTRYEAISVARQAFGGIMPSPIIFRFNNEDEVYQYDPG